jgi:hypothetical protein
VTPETGCAHAAVFNNWQAVLVRRKPEDLLGNNINHRMISGTGFISAFCVNSGFDRT